MPDDFAFKKSNMRVDCRMTGNIPTKARAVIIGGGVSGCSVAYHLTLLGWRMSSCWNASN